MENLTKILLDLVKQYPNDIVLGKKVRKLVNDNKDERAEEATRSDKQEESK